MAEQHGALSAKDDYDHFLELKHRPAHGRRTADRWAAHLLPHLQPEMRLLDVGCGPGSITVGLGTQSIGVDVAPVTVDGVPVAAADGGALPFPDATFDALFLNAVLQHVRDPLAVLCEARRVARPGAVIGIGDADWGAALFHPHEPLIDRAWEIRAALRTDGHVYVGRALRGLLSDAGFERVELSVTGNCAGTAEAVLGLGYGEWTWFEAPEAVAYVTELGVSDPEEMQAIAEAWKRWSGHPAATATTFWFTALAWAPT